MLGQFLKEECEMIRFADGLPEPVWERAEVEEQITQAIRSVSIDQIYELKVEVNRDMVVLEGQTAWYRWKKAAQDAAMDALGNVQLVNRIEVRWTPAYNGVNLNGAAR